MGEKCRILIVEDEMRTRQALRYIIDSQRERYAIVGEASNGEEAKDLIEKEKPHIIISDIVMPVLDGVSLTRYVKWKHPEICMIIISGHSDFDYVKETFKFGVFEYILKPKLEPEMLLNILNKATKYLGISWEDTNDAELLKQTTKGIFEKMVQGSHKGITTAELRKLYPNPYFYLIACDLKDIQSFRADKERICFELLYDQLKKSTNQPNEIILTSGKRLLMLVNSEQGNRERILQRATLVAEDLSQKISDIHFGVSDVFMDIYDLSKVLLAMEDILAASFYEPGERVHFQWQFESGGMELRIPEKEVGSLMKKSMVMEALDEIAGFIESIDVKDGIPEARLKEGLENCFYLILNDMKDDGEKQRLKMTSFRDIQKACDIQALKEVCGDTIEVIRQDVLSHQETNSLLYQIYQYVESNYQEPMSLKDLSKEMHISYSYLSSYFSKNANSGFNEYVNQVRIEKAKHLLAYGNMSLGEVSHAVGYMEPSYFSKVFKKLVKCSPSDYRKEMRRKYEI